MRVKLEFNLPEEQEEYELTMKAGSRDSAIREFDQWLRQRTKYGPSPGEWPTEKDREDYLSPPESIPPYNELVAAYFFNLVRDKLWEVLNEYECSLG